MVSDTPCCTHFGNLKCAKQGNGYCWPLLALGGLFSKWKSRQGSGPELEKNRVSCLLKNWHISASWTVKDFIIYELCLSFGLSNMGKNTVLTGTKWFYAIEWKCLRANIESTTENDLGVFLKCLIGEHYLIERGSVVEGIKLFSISSILIIQLSL